MIKRGERKKKKSSGGEKQVVSEGDKMKGILGTCESESSNQLT